MLLRTTYRQDNAHFEQDQAPLHSKVFSGDCWEGLNGRFLGHEIFAFGTREFLCEISDAVMRGRQIVHNGIFSAEFENPGLLIICDNVNHCVFAQSDLAGIFQAFWTVSDRGFAISDSLSHLRSAFPGETDEIGIIEYMRLDYMIGQRTLFRNIKRLRPGESLRLNWDSMKIELTDSSTLWTRKQEISPKSAISKACELLIDSCRAMKGTMLMMSGGWDSRTLLAGAYGAGVADQITLYHHGHLESREARIVKRQAAQLQLRLMLRQLDPTLFDSDFLAQSFGLFENVYHPHWHAAAHFAAEPGNGITSVCAGIFGEVIGGHYGPPMLLGGRRKIISTFGYLSGIPALAHRYNLEDRDDARDAAALLYQLPYGVPWFINDQLWHERFGTINESVNADVERAVDRYIARGIATKESIVEAFLTENRGGQTISSQLRSASTFKPLLAPFCNREFLEFACTVPFEQKANNSLDRMMIRKLYPKLLDFPTAAIICRTSRPILFQEATRAIRRIWEKSLWDMYIRSKGKTPPPNAGWPNFQFLHQSNVINDLIDSLQSPIWDKGKMKAFTNSYGYNNYHGIEDVLMRIKTLDLFGIA